jgi:FkbM family methyltransferase
MKKKTTKIIDTSKYEVPATLDSREVQRITEEIGRYLQLIIDNNDSFPVANPFRNTNKSEIKINDVSKFVLSKVLNSKREQQKYNAYIKNILFNIVRKIDYHDAPIQDMGQMYSRYQSMQQQLDEIQLKKKRWLPGRFFSQFSEDEWIVKNIKVPKKGYFVDVGAADGITFSNSYYFELAGWNGVCLEPDPRNFEFAKKRRKKIYQYAAGSKNGKAEFFISDLHPDLSGLKSQDLSKESYQVKVVTLDSILAKEKVKKIDLLTIDTEGTELDVWKGLNVKKYKPEVVIIEYMALDKANYGIKDHVIKEGYELMLQTKANYILRRKQK